MAGATTTAMNVFSGQVCTYAGHVIRCDLGDEQEDIENTGLGTKRIFIQTMFVAKASMPAGVVFATGGTVMLDGVRREIRAFNEDEISYSIALTNPRQK